MTPSRYQLSIPHHGAIYEITIQSPTILSITKIMPDSDMSRPLTFDDLPQEVQDNVIQKIEETE